MGSQGWLGAIASGNYEQIKQLTPHMAGTRNHLGETGLMIAVRLGDNRTVRILEPFESTILNAEDETALMIAIRCHNVAAAKILVNAEYCVTKQDGTTALHLAIQLGHTQFIEILEPYLKHTADKSGVLALSDSRSLQPSPPSPNTFDSSNHKREEAIVSSNIFKKRASGIHATDSLSNYLDSSVQSRQPQSTNREGTQLLIDIDSISTEPSLHRSAAMSRLSTKSAPRLSPRVRIEMAGVEDVMVTDCAHNIDQAESMKAPDLDTVVYDVCTNGSTNNTNNDNSNDNDSNDNISMLSKASSAKKAYIHAQLQYTEILNALESLYQIPSFIALSSYAPPNAPRTPLGHKAPVVISLLLIVNPFIREGVSRMFENMEKTRFRTPIALEHTACMVGTAYAADLPTVFICATPDLISAIVPCRGTLQVEEAISNLSTEGVFAAVLSPLFKERYMCLAESFSSKSMPHAGHLCDQRYICVHKIAKDVLYRLCQPILDVCKVYPLCNSDTINEVSNSNARVISEDPSSKQSSDFLIQVCGASKAESLLICLTFGGYKASFLSFYDFTEIDLPNEIFIQT